MEQMINVVFCMDSNYTQHAAAALVSLLMHNKPSELKIFIVSSQISKEDSGRLKAVADRFNTEFDFRYLDKKTLPKLKKHLHMTEATYYRLLLPELLTEINKVIYLDSDTLIETNLHELWNTDLENFGVAGYDEEKDFQTQRLDLEPDFYINAGILVINLSFWRENSISLKCFDWLKKNPDKNLLLDQDAINSVLKFKKTRIGLKWNLGPASFEDRKILENYPERILHFGAPIKPWHKCYDFDLQDLYRKYISYTPWKNLFKPAEPCNVAQASLVANQYYYKNNFYEACLYYNQAIQFRIQVKLLESKLLLEVINGGHRHFNNYDFFSACEHYRACMEFWGYPLTYDLDIYKIPGIVENMF
ncbi:MAG: glycosyltransferase family 8 protein [Candidatus Riflebacteria bacterium]|nr:glycosyltransferase family 8 protein [Candidatus Riflebacteria bacterium]